jgi:long-chain acyl-CoA synthetase
MLTNRNFTKFCELEPPDDLPWWRVNASDISIVAMPLFHIGGLETAVRLFYSGARMILHREFDAPSVLKSIEHYRPTILALVPTALQMVLRAPGADEVDFKCIRAFFYGAAPIPLELLREALGVMQCGFVQCYGLSEATGAILCLPPEDHDPAGGRRMTAAGKPLPNVEVRVVDLDGKDTPPDSIGEVLLRAPYVMKGYWKNPSATEAAIDAEGWLHTGDAGALDADGYLYIHDRIKDMIISGGENIYPAEVESAIYGHPDVAEVAIIGVPDPLWGESVRAVVVPKAGSQPDVASITKWARERVSAYKAPKSVRFVDDLPKNATGKVLKTELRKTHGC